MPFALTMWLTQVFVDCNRFNKGEINEARIEWTLNPIPHGGGADSTSPQIVFFITSIRNVAQQQNLANFPKI